MDTRITVASAVEEYLNAATDRGISSDTKQKKVGTFKSTLEEEKGSGKLRYSPSLLGWCKERGIVHLEQLGTRELTQWRATWAMKSLAKHKRQGMVCGFFYFCIRQGWLKRNPMLDVGA